MHDDLDSAETLLKNVGHSWVLCHYFVDYFQIGLLALVFLRDFVVRNDEVCEVDARGLIFRGFDECLLCKVGRNGMRNVLF